ncbi:MAG: hypothetical protein WBP93_03060, partial [Pyrinomonadaceae bacterium]
FCAVCALILSACAAARSPDAAGPRANEALYPVVITDDESRRETTLAIWNGWTKAQGVTNAPAPELQPVTATIKSLPANLNTPLYLPKVGAEALMTEEETRESLRRFIISAKDLIGAEPQQLSLVQTADLADGTKEALYQQRPFRYPLRNGYGQLTIKFAPDRRLLQLSSTCVPEVERIQKAVAGGAPKFTAEEIAKRIVGRTFTYEDANGNQQSYTVSASDPVNVRELVIYPHTHAGTPPLLEFHFTWEIVVGAAPARTVYLDAFTDEIIDATHVAPPT